MGGKNVWRTNFDKFIEEHGRLSEQSLYWSMVLSKFFPVLPDLTLSY